MIDIENETIVPLGEVPRRLPSSRPGKKLSVVTVHRWAAKGLLETVRIGGGRFTTLEAIRRMVRRDGRGVAATRRPAAQERDAPLTSAASVNLHPLSDARRAGEEVDILLGRALAAGRSRKPGRILTLRG